MSKYTITDDHRTIMASKDGDLELANFAAEIAEQAIIHDAAKKTTVLHIHGWMGDDTLEEAVVPASEFPSMAWVAECWGLTPIIYPHPSAERHLRTAIQTNSAPKTTHVYTSTGWSDLRGKRAFLHADGAITAKGFDKNVSVQLPTELRHYALPKPDKEQAKTSLQHSLALSAIAPEIMVPILLATYRAAIGPADFAVHLAGRTGSFKTELCSLAQSHYGPGMDSRHLPASWSSTPNAIEQLAHRAANALIVLDDFVPQGTAYQVRQMQSAADKIIRAQGNQAGRSRMNAESGMQQTYYPRGVILSTGEDVPEGHSVRARMMILETTPGAISTDALTKAQASRTCFCHAMADWIQWLAANDIAADFRGLKASIRDAHLGVGHARTPGTIADLIATAEYMAMWASQRKYLTEANAKLIVQSATEACLQAGEQQGQYLMSADPAEAFLEAIQTALSGQTGHLRTKNGGIPKEPTRFGWIEQEKAGEMASYKAAGTRVGWIDTTKGELYVDPATIPALKRIAGGRITIGQPTLLKRLKEAGILTRVDSARQRNTCRVTLQGHPRQVLVMNAVRALALED